MKIAIVGSRDYQNLKQVREYVYSLPKDTVIISGGAKGVDSVAEKAAKERGMAVEVFLPDWDRFGRAAGPIRNQQIVDAADLVVAFWRKGSRGTWHTIQMAKKANKMAELFEGEMVTVFAYPQEQQEA